MLVDFKYELCSGGRYTVSIYRSCGRCNVEALILMAKQQGLDQSHMDVYGGNFPRERRSHLSGSELGRLFSVQWRSGGIPPFGHPVQMPHEFQRCQ